MIYFFFVNVLGQLEFCLFDDRQDPGFALVRAVSADPQIGLLGGGVSEVVARQFEHLDWRCKLDVAEQTLVRHFKSFAKLFREVKGRTQRPGNNGVSQSFETEMRKLADKAGSKL